MTDEASGKASEGKPSESPAKTAQSDEMELIHRARRGDTGAYDDLVRRYQERSYATICMELRKRPAVARKAFYGALGMALAAAATTGSTPLKS